MPRSYRICLLICIGYLVISCTPPPEYHYVLAEYDLAPCPPSNYELPELVYEPDFKIEANGWGQYCHGFTRYELEDSKTKWSEFGHETDLRGDVYARIVPGHSCRLQVVAEVRCHSYGTKRKDSCEEWLVKAYGKDFLAFATTQTDSLAKNIFHALKYKARENASKVGYLGNGEEIAKKCAEIVGS